MRTCGGDCEAETISEMKFAVMPIMVMRQTTCMARTTFQVAARAPPEVRADILEGGASWGFCMEMDDLLGGLKVELKVLSK